MLRWYDRHRRDLPWRRTSDPYCVWLSEMMLQQTQVATVIPYYERFLTRFPTIQSLAAASLDDVLPLWAGLGYYARARNLHAAARLVVERFGGAFPTTVDELQSLPGIGRYTAGAIASICFDRRAAVLDGNVARVLARLLVISRPIDAAATKAELWRLAESLLPRRRCGDFNQAMMELGATVCTPSAPRCSNCPLADVCRARAAGVAADLPVKSGRPAVRRMRIAVVAIERGGRWLVERRAERGLWGGLWQLPAVELSDGESSWSAASRLARERLGGGVRVSRKPAAEVDWKLTHRDVRFVVHRARSGSTAPRRTTTSGRLAWLTQAELSRVAVSAAMHKVLAALSRDRAG